MNYKTILVAMLIMAMIVPSMAATGNELMRIYTCESEDIDLMDDEPANIIEFVGLDYTRGNLIVENGETYAMTYGEKIAMLTDNGCGLFTVTPLNKGKVSVYYKVATESGKIYTRFLNLGVSSYCMNQQICDTTFFNQGAIDIYQPIVGEQLDTTIYFPGNGEMSSIVTFDGAVSEDRIYRGETCIVVTAYVDGIPYACNGMTL